MRDRSRTAPTSQRLLGQKPGFRRSSGFRDLGKRARDGAEIAEVIRSDVDLRPLGAPRAAA